MAAWTPARALEPLKILPALPGELVEELMIRAGNSRDGDISRKMTVAFHTDGVLSQFEGYEQIPEFDWVGYRASTETSSAWTASLKLKGTARIATRSPSSRRLMLLYLLSRTSLRPTRRHGLQELRNDSSDRRLLPGTTSHGSTLSSVVAASVLARYDPDEAWQCLQRALQSDIADVQGGTTAEGIHLGAMAGTVDLVLRCLTGMRARGQVLRFDPAIPPEIKQLQFSVHYRSHRVELVFSEDRIEVNSPPRPGSTHYCLGARRRCGLAPRRAAYLLT